MEIWESVRFSDFFNLKLQFRFSDLKKQTILLCNFFGKIKRNVFLNKNGFRSNQSKYKAKNDVLKKINRLQVFNKNWYVGCCKIEMLGILKRTSVRFFQFRFRTGRITNIFCSCRQKYITKLWKKKKVDNSYNTPWLTCQSVKKWIQKENLKKTMHLKNRSICMGLKIWIWKQYFWR